MRNTGERSRKVNEDQKGDTRSYALGWDKNGALILDVVRFTTVQSEFPAKVIKVDTVLD